MSTNEEMKALFKRYLNENSDSEAVAKMITDAMNEAATEVAKEKKEAEEAAAAVKKYSNPDSMYDYLETNIMYSNKATLDAEDMVELYLYYAFGKNPKLADTLTPERLEQFKKLAVKLLDATNFAEFEYIGSKGHDFFNDILHNWDWFNLLP